MSVKHGVRVIVNADVEIRDVTPGKTYEAQGGLHELPGATIISDASTVKYLEPEQFVYEDGKQNPSSESSSSEGRDLSEYLKP